jgi:tRNA modification GTPase
MTASDTIFALSSGHGMAGIAVIRVSGKAAATVIQSLSGALPPPRMASLRNLYELSNRSLIDQAVVLWMPGPSSSTGEDVAEFHVHGSLAVIEAVSSALAALPGVRLAQPGEFTRRAFVNGKLDLVEAEGLADLLHARTDAQRKLALHHMTGGASALYDLWREEMLGILAYLEASIDFAEEEGVVAQAIAKVRPKTAFLISAMENALADAEYGSRVRDGVRIVFAGPPNAGKSSLLNALARREAAIVSSIPGTTRDTIEVPIVLAGLPVILTDTAGLRTDSGDEIEGIGMSRTETSMRHADILVWVVAPDVDCSIEPTVEPGLTVATKSDLKAAPPIHIRNKAHLRVSSKTMEGMAELVAQLEKRVKQISSTTEHPSIIRARHKAAAEESIRMLNESLLHDSGEIELAAECVRNASMAMARVTGRIDVEDMLGKIFSEFCIGK